MQDIHRDDFEIICINDGSPDNSREIVLHLKKEFPNILLVDQENQGVSVARNTGVERATGRFLLFIDPDDYVCENSLGMILKHADLKSAQLTVPGYTYLDSQGSIIGEKTFGSYQGNILNGIDAYYILRGHGLKPENHSDEIIPDSSVGIIFEADFFRKKCLGYVPGIILFQDAEILARIHCVADRCLLLNQFLYNAVIRKGSATHSDQFYKQRVRNGFILAARNISVFRQIGLLNEKQKLFLNGPVVQFVLLALYSAATTRSIKKYADVVSDLNNSGLGKLKLKGCKGYHLICGLFYNLSPYLGVLALVSYLKIDYWYTTFIKRKFIKHILFCPISV